MRTFLLDTSFIFSFADKSDTNHLAAYSRIFSTQDNILRFHVPFIVVAELSVGSAEFDFLALAKHLSPQFLKNNEKDLEFITRLPVSLARSLKANDCLILALAARHKLELLTFDDKLQEAYAQIMK